jgi:hypothetical protein
MRWNSKLDSARDGVLIAAAFPQGSLGSLCLNGIRPCDGLERSRVADHSIRR